MTKRPSKKVPPSCLVYYDRCSQHGFVHGAEAEELRKGIDRLIKQMGYEPLARGWRESLIKLLDRVDARDSLAFLDARAERKKRRQRHGPPARVDHFCVVTFKGKPVVFREGYWTTQGGSWVHKDTYDLTHFANASQAERVLKEWGCWGKMRTAKFMKQFQIVQMVQWAVPR